MSEEQPQRVYLANQINQRIANFQSSQGWYRTRYYVATMSTVVLSAVITVLAGLKFSYISQHQMLKEWVDFAILTLGTAVTVLSAWGAFFAPKETWLLVAESLNRMRALQARMEYEMSSSPSASAEVLKGIFDDYQKILDEHNQKWEALRQRQPTK